MKKEYDVIVIGAGIVGLAVALAAAERGKKVAIFERHPKAASASIRNFGMIWPIGQPVGNLFDRAMRSRETWLRLAKAGNFWARESGSLHLAYHDDEMQVLEEFIQTTKGGGYQCELISPEKVRKYSPLAHTEGLKGALRSETEVNVHSRLAIDILAQYLENQYNVNFYFNKVITGVEFPFAYTFEEVYQAREHIFVCNGVDFETLYPSVFRRSGITKCKLQMLSTVAQSEKFDMGAMFCGGLTLLHYASFSHCQSLKALEKRFDSQEPLYKKYGIHILVSQNSWGQLIIGDSHEYGLELDPFDKENINELIFNYLKTLANIPNPTISERWHGIYPKLAGQTAFIYHPEENVTILNGLSGAGMTLSFGLAQEIVATTFGE